MSPVAHPIGAQIYVFGGQQTATDFISTVQVTVERGIVVTDGDV